MAPQMSKCPRCAELVPAARLEEHLHFHEKYGTGIRRQKPLEKGVARETDLVANNTLKEVSGKYHPQSPSGTRKETSEAVESDQAPSVQLEERRTKPERAESVRGDLDKPVKTMIIDGKVYVDRTIKAPVTAEIAEILQRSKKRSAAAAAQKTQERPSERLEPEPADPRLASLETFQDFLLYAAEIRLREREFDMLCQRFGLLDGEGRTLAEVAKIHGLSRERIRQLVDRSMKKIVTLGTRQLKTKQWKMPCAMVVAYAHDDIRHDQEGAIGRFLDFADAELPHLSLDLTVNLLGFFFGGRRGIKTYRRRLSRQLEEEKSKRLSENRRRKRRTQIKKLLEDTIWPQNARQVNLQAVHTWEPKRQVSPGSIGITGHWPSSKMGRQIAYESKLEHDFLELLETYDDVVFFLEQPLKIPYATEAGTHTYYPDLLLVLNDGRAIVVEIKPPQGMAMRHNWLKWSAMRAYCDTLGYGFLVTDGRKSIQQVSREEVRPQVRQQLLEALRRGPLDWQQYKALRRNCSIKTAELYSLIIKEKLQWQLRPFRLERADAT